MLEYVSTRDDVPPTDYNGTILAGQAGEGLFVPKEFPQIPLPQLYKLSHATYAQFACFVLGYLAPSYGLDELAQDVLETYTSQNFPNALYGDAGEIVPVTQLDERLWITDLNGGPTLAFKDIALQLLARQFRRALDGRTLNIVGATSGDTGSAAIEAMRHMDGINTFMLSPAEGMSSFQAYQIWGVIDPSVINFAVNGDFDACQRVVKAIFADQEFKGEYNLGAVNSINWARIAAQVVYYFWTYMKVDGGKGEEVQIVVPTGNFGNIFAAYTAMRMGLPIRLVLATNQNDVLHEFYQTGVYQPRTRAKVSSSPSMDITAASNWERWLWAEFGQDPKFVRHCFAQLKSYGRIDLSGDMDRVTGSGIVSHAVSEEACWGAMKFMYVKYGLIIDPHTAVSMEAARRSAQDGIPTAIMSTANPCKFGQTVWNTLEAQANPPASFANWREAPPEYRVIDPDAQVVRQAIIEHT